MKTSVRAIRNFVRRTLALETSKRQQRKLDKTSGATKIAENDIFIVLKILSRQACIFYGKGTKWCVSSRDEEESYREFITNQDSLYIVIYKNSQQKFAVVVSPGSDIQIWNEANVTVDHSKVPREALVAIFADYMV